MAVDLGIFGEPLFIEVVLPFVLMFVVIYAILQKTKILGESRQIDSIVSFVFALIFVAVPFAAGITTKIIPVIGVFIVVILVFLLMWGFIGGQVTPVNKGIRIAAGILMLVTLIITVLWATDFLDEVLSWFKLPFADKLISSLVLVVFIAAIFAIVLTSRPNPEDAKPKSS